MSVDPIARGLAAKALANGGGLNLGSTAITGGADKQILFNDGGFAGSSSALTFTKGIGLLATTQVSTTSQISTPQVAISASGVTTYGSDVQIWRDTAGVLSQRASATAQGWRAYNTFTDASNGEWGVFDWTTTANTLTIGTAANGTGTARNTVLKGGSTSLTLGASSITLSGGLSLSGAYGGNGNWWSTSAINIASTTTLTWGASDTRVSRLASGILKLDNNSTGPGVFVTNPTTVASLPAAATAGAGARAFVTDATATTYGTIVSGGGSNKVPVWGDGTNWIIG